MLLTQKQAAAELQVSVKTLQRMRNAGELQFIRWGYRSIRIREAELERLKQRYTQSLPAQAGEGAESAAPTSGQAIGAVPASTEVRQ